LAQRGHNKQGRYNLSQVGLSYVLDGENLKLCHHVYRGNVAGTEEFFTSLVRTLSKLHSLTTSLSKVLQALPPGVVSPWNNSKRSCGRFSSSYC
jgi:hypothetical protein